MPIAARRPTFPPYLILAVTCAGIFLAALDQTVVVTALPSIMTDLRLPITELDRVAWIVTGYLLGYTVAMPFMGKVSDVCGHGRIYILSLLFFMIGSIFVALAHSLGWLVGARIFQAVGGGAVVPVAMAIAGDVFAERRRAVALGIIGAAAEAGAVLGPLWGGIIVQHLSWRWIFWVNLPLGFLILLLIALFVGPSPRSRVPIDYFGGFLLAASLAFLALALSRGFSQASPYPFLLLGASILFFISFLFRESGATAPLIELPLFRNITFSAANLTHLFIGGALIMAMVNIPLITDTIMARSPLEGGLRLMRLTAAIPVGALAGGFLCQRLGYRLPTALGLLAAALSFFFLSRWGLDIGDPEMTLHLILGGVGFGLVIAPIATAAINSVREEQRGTGAALVVVMRMVGMMIGLSALTSWGMGRFQALTAGISLESLVTDPEQIIGPTLALFHDFFLAALAVCLVAILPAMALGWRRKR